MEARNEESCFPLPCFYRNAVNESVRPSFHFFGQFRSPFLSALASVRPLSPLTGMAQKAAADDSIDKGWTTGRRTDGRTDAEPGQFLHSPAAESFSSLPPAPLPRSLEDGFCSSMSSAR